MSVEVLLIAGLPGCGKTTHMCAMCREGWLALDDFKANAHKNSSAFKSSRKYEALVAALRDGLRCVVADIDFCKAQSRREAEQVLRAAVAGVAISWRFFANDRAACEANIRQRKRESLEEDLRKLYEYAEVYSIPPGASVLPIGRRMRECGAA